MANPLDIEAIPSDSTNLSSNDLIEKGVIPKHGYSICFCGGTGSGKSTLLINMLNKFYKDIYDHKDVYIISPVAEEDNMVKKMGIPQKNYITGNVISNLETLVVNRKKEIKKAGGPEKTKPMLIILEDSTADRNLMKSKVYVTLITASRHLNISTWCCIHNYRTLKPVIRNNIMSWYIFEQNPLEQKKMEEEMNVCMKKKDFFKLFQFATEEQHSFLTFYRKQPRKLRFRKNLSLILELC